MPKVAADPPARSCYSPVSEAGIEELQAVDPDLFFRPAHARDGWQSIVGTPARRRASFGA
jgi:hypothetical protein